MSALVCAWRSKKIIRTSQFARNIVRYNLGIDIRLRVDFKNMEDIEFIVKLQEARLRLKCSKHWKARRSKRTRRYADKRLSDKLIPRTVKPSYSACALIAQIVGLSLCKKAGMHVVLNLKKTMLVQWSTLQHALLLHEFIWYKRIVTFSHN